MKIQEFLKRYRVYVASPVDAVGVKIRKCLPKDLVIENRSEFYSFCETVFGSDNPVARHHYKNIWNSFIFIQSLEEIQVAND